MPNKKLCFLFIYVIIFPFITSCLPAQNKKISGNATVHHSVDSLGLFAYHTNIGAPKLSGDAKFDISTKSYYLKGAGYNVWFDRDEFYYLYNRVKGDFTLTANFELLNKSKDPLRKAGWMVRASLEDNAVHASAVVHGDGLTLLQWRPRKGVRMRSPNHELYASASHYDLLQLERSGQQITMRVARKGEPLETIGSHELANLPASVFAGLFICSHNADAVEEARIWNVEIRP